MAIRRVLGGRPGSKVAFAQKNGKVECVLCTARPSLWCRASIVWAGIPTCSRAIVADEIDLRRHLDQQIARLGTF